ncbi:MAG: dephospho-CoA kinase [Bacteroidota bacterium]
MSLLHIGVTGGIGSGKSTVCRIFESLGYAVYYADERAKHLMVSNSVIIEGLISTFGKEVYHADGSLNRAYLGGQVFGDANKLQALNHIVHPETAKDYVDWAHAMTGTYTLPFVLKEAAILFESGAARFSDRVITVYAPTSLRLKRVIARDQSSEAAVLARMDKQWAEQKKLLRSDWIIANDEQHHLIPQVLAAAKYFTP